MTTPAVVQGTVVRPAIPTAVIDPFTTATHDFFDMLKSIIHKTNVFHTEQEALSAFESVDKFAKQILALKNLRPISSETDRAPIEDVRLRKAPNATPVPASSGAAIDYNLLAQAILSAQAQMEAAAAQQQAQAQLGHEPGQAAQQ